MSAFVVFLSGAELFLRSRMFPSFTWQVFCSFHVCLNSAAECKKKEKGSENTINTFLFTCSAHSLHYPRSGSSWVATVSGVSSETGSTFLHNTCLTSSEGTLPLGCLMCMFSVILVAQQLFNIHFQIPHSLNFFHFTCFHDVSCL